MCAPDHGGVGSSFPKTALLAVFDHGSTYSLAVADKYARPGVSVNLAMEYTPESHTLMRPGAVLVMQCTPIKIGGQIGFAECSVRCADTQQLVARGRHVKYMPMFKGKLWQLACSEKNIARTSSVVEAVGAALRSTNPLMNALSKAQLFPNGNLRASCFHAPLSSQHDLGMSRRSVTLPVHTTLYVLPSSHLVGSCPPPPLSCNPNRACWRESD